MQLASIPPCIWITAGAVVLFILFGLMPEKIFEKFFSRKDSKSNPLSEPEDRLETRSQAWLNSQRETYNFLKESPDTWSSDGVMPVIGWRKLK